MKEKIALLPTKTKILYLVSIAAFLRSFAQVIYVPSLVTMRGDLDTTTTMLGLTLSVYGLCLAFSQIAYGPIVDRLDSKRILLIGITVYALGSLAAYLTRGIELLILARALQALGIAAAASVGIAMITDAFPTGERSRALGVFSMFNSIGASAAPAAGALIAVVANWRIDFLVLAVIGFAMAFFTLWQLPATPAHAQHVGLREMWRIARTPATFGAIALGFVCFYGVYTVHTLMPVLLSERLHAHEGIIGLVGSFVAGGVILGTWIGGRAADQRGLRFSLVYGALSAAIAFAVVAAISFIATDATPVAVFALAIFVYGFAAGFGFGPQLAIMVDFFPAQRGTAGALQYFARFAGTTLAPSLGGFFTDQFNVSVGFGFAAALLFVGALIAFATIRDPSSMQKVNA